MSTNREQDIEAMDIPRAQKEYLLTLERAKKKLPPGLEIVIRREARGGKK